MITKNHENDNLIVASYMGAWIEISGVACRASFTLVASYMGAWIEITI